MTQISVSPHPSPEPGARDWLILFASLFLGESLEPFHLTGIGLVMGGVIPATVQPSALRWFRVKAGS